MRRRLVGTMDGFRQLISRHKFAAVFSSRWLCCALIVSLIGLTLPSAGFARLRVETGRDLHQFCQMAAEQNLAHPNERLTGKARYCRQYVSGFFSSLRAMQTSEGTRKVHQNNEPDRFQCALVPRIASYEQLERQIVQSGEWHPELLDEPAIQLIQRAFDSLDPC